MTRRLANLQFQRDVVRLGVEADLLGDLLYTLPADAHVVGFSEDLFTQTVNIVVQSNRFPEQVVGSELPSFTAIFTEDDYGNVHVDTDIDEVFPRDFDMPTDDDVIGDEDKIRGLSTEHCFYGDVPEFKAPDMSEGYFQEIETITDVCGALTVETLREAKRQFDKNSRTYPEIDFLKYYDSQVKLYRQIGDISLEQVQPLKSGIAMQLEKAAQDAAVFGEGIIHIPEGTEIKPEYLETQCSHQWENYTGLNETFEYCVHCDEKRNIRKG